MTICKSIKNAQLDNQRNQDLPEKVRAAWGSRGSGGKAAEDEAAGEELDLQKVPCCQLARGPSRLPCDRLNVLQGRSLKISVSLRSQRTGTPSQTRLALPRPEVELTRLRSCEWCERVLPRECKTNYCADCSVVLQSSLGDDGVRRYEVVL
eukprot:757680-Hanusia_phi.AAC.3